MKTIIDYGIVLMLLAVGILTACGGGGGVSTPATGFTQAYTSSAGVGEILQFSVNTTNLTYIYTVIQTSYAASGVAAGQSGTGTLTSNGDGSYAVGSSSDNFIQSGKAFPIQNGLLVGHVLINVIGGTNKIPVFGVSNPITTIAGLAGTYNYQGFGCNTLGIANVSGNSACLSQYGTVTITSSGNYTKCKNVNITTNPSCTAATGSIVATSTPGVYDFKNSSNAHSGWFFASTAPNGQIVAVIDHDDTTLGVYGHSVAITQASGVAGTADGNYFVKNNEGGEHLMTITGTSFTSNNHSGVTGTLTFNSPWQGLTAYSINAESGVAMAAGDGAYTATSATDTAKFSVGLRY